MHYGRGRVRQEIYDWAAERMKRKLIPPSTRDRIGVSAALFSSIIAALVLRMGDYGFALFLIVGALILLFMAYVIQDQPFDPESTEEYSDVIARIGLIGAQLSELSQFLERERTRVAEAEATVLRLNNEKAKLEPIVSTQRETVEAILAAHSERTAGNAWKERFLGFIFGVGASLVASFFYDYLR